MDVTRERCKKIIDAVAEDEKLEAVGSFQQHIEDAKKERSHYY